MAGTEMQGATFVWTGDCQKAFDGVKEAITVDVVLALCDPNALTFLYTDASGVGISAVLSQEQGVERSLLHALATHCNQQNEITVL